MTMYKVQIIQSEPPHSPIIHMGHDARKPDFGVSNQVRLKTDCSAIDTSRNIEILHVAS